MTDSSANFTTSLFIPSSRRILNILKTGPITDPWETATCFLCCFLSFNKLLIYAKNLLLALWLLSFLNSLLWGTLSKAFWKLHKFYPPGFSTLLLAHLKASDGLESQEKPWILSFFLVPKKQTLPFPLLNGAREGRVATAQLLPTAALVDMLG